MHSALKPSNPHSAHRCWVEVDCAALRHNIAVIRSHIVTGPIRIMAVIKADAYGHGVDVVARELAPIVEMFGVANVVEAEELRQIAPAVPILILGPALDFERQQIVENGFTPFVSSLEEAEAYAALVHRLGLARPFSIHLKVDTGMGRIGVWWQEAVSLAKAIAAMPELQLSGIATHLPVSDEDAAWTAAQLSLWNTLTRELRAVVPGISVVHSLNSAGVIRFNDQPAARTEFYAGDMVRAGLMIYGSSPVPEFQPRLLPALTWKARITLLRDVPAGRGISYGRTFITPHPMRIATVGMGYADGYPRQLSGARAEVLIGGRRCPVVGRVTMDQILVDASAVPDAAAGDEVVVLGTQGAEEIPASELAAKAATIAWDVFTGISARVKRCYTQQDYDQG